MNAKPKRGNGLPEYRDWITVAEAASQISQLLNKQFPETEIWRLALDRKLQLSIFLPDPNTARKARVAPPDGRALRPRARAAEEIPLNREQVLRLSSRITKVEGLWDLPFIGGDERHVRRLWESAVSGTPISRDEPEQIWLRDGDTWCQLTRGPVLERGSWRDTTGQAVPFPRGYLVLRGAEWAALRERLTSGAGQNTRALGTRERNTLYRIIYALLLSGKYDLAHLSKTAQSLSAQTALGDQPVDAQTIVKHLRAVMELARSESPARTK